MEDRKEITADATSRLIYQALLELQLGNEAVREAEKDLSRISGEIRQDPALSDTGREKMLAYIRQLTLLTDKQYRHIYRQGAKDCVVLLRELGVIK